MGRVRIYDGTTEVDLTNDNPDVRATTEWVFNLNLLFGTGQTELINEKALTDVFTITCRLNDVTKYNNLKSLQANAPTPTNIVFYWNDTDATPPTLKVGGTAGQIKVGIASVTLGQPPGQPTTVYDMTVKLYGDTFN